MPDELVELPDSHRDLPAGAQRVRDVDPNEQLTVTVYVRRDPAAPIVDPGAEAQKPPASRRYLTSPEVAASFGAANADLQAVVDYAHSKGLETSDVSNVKRSVKVTGPAGALSSAFGVALAHYQHGHVTFRGRQGAVKVPPSLTGIVEAVLGFDNRPLGRSYLRSPDKDHQFTLPVSEAATQPLPPDNYYPPQVGALYDFPSAYDGTGETVAVFVFNGTIGSGISAPGGYKSTLLDQYFSQVLKMTVPELTNVVVMGPGNDPGNGSTQYDVSDEVYLDLCMVGSLAPGAKIAVYFTEFTEQGWVDAISQAATDAETDPSVLSISYGNPETGSGSAWTAMAIKQVNQAFEAAASAGRTICCAAGDSGAADESGTSSVHVDFPASSPWVLGCGGTRLAATGGKITSEVVWNDLSMHNGATGGGVSAVFPRPTWQSGVRADPLAGVTAPSDGRGVPDVASLADPQTPYVIMGPAGTLEQIGGTSAAAPLWAALASRLNQAIGTRVGFLNPLLYSQLHGALRDITTGNNGGYEATVGWDACTGWGSPGASALLAGLQGLSASATTSADSSSAGGT